MGRVRMERWDGCRIVVAWRVSTISLISFFNFLSISGICKHDKRHRLFHLFSQLSMVCTLPVLGIVLYRCNNLGFFVLLAATLLGPIIATPKLKNLK